MGTRQRILLRADGNQHMGLGHVYRCIALAEMLTDDFECIFAIQQPSDQITAQINNYCKDVIKLPIASAGSKEFLHELELFLTGDEIVVLDGYAFNTAYQEYIKNKGCSLICIDDIFSYHFVADVVVNHAVGFSPSDYSVAPNTKCFFGPSYALLREVFIINAKKRSATTKQEEILISLGGSDPRNDTLQVLKQLAQTHKFKNFRLNIVIGSAYKYLTELEHYIASTDRKIALYQNVNAFQMVDLMQRASAAICSPSTVTFEYLSVGTGVLYLVCIADNQLAFYDYLIQSRIAFDFFNDFDNITERNSSAFEFQNLFDGGQKERYRKIFSDLSYL